MEGIFELNSGYPFGVYKFPRTQNINKALFNKRCYLFRFTLPGAPLAAPVKPGSVDARAFTLTHVVPQDKRVSKSNNDNNPSSSMGINSGTSNSDPQYREGTFVEVESVPDQILGATTKNAAESQTIATLPKQVSIPDLFNPADIQDAISIRQFLAKPIAMQHGVLAATDGPTTFTAASMPSTIMGNTMVANKMSGIAFFKGDSIFTLTVNANKFQAGRYILAWVQTGGSAQSSFSTSWYVQHRFTLTQITQLPHVEIDINCETQCTLRVPFSSVEANYSMYSGGVYSDTGWVVIIPYYPLVTTAGVATASWTLWHSFENVVLSGPTVPQSANWKVSTRKSPTSKEQEEFKPISSSLTIASKVASAFGVIPSISPFAGTASWVFDVMSGVAKSFGYCRPTHLAPFSRMISNPYPMNANCDVSDAGQPLSVASNNEIEHLQGVFGTDMDEMSFDFFKQIPSYIYTFAWTTGNVYGDTLFSRSVTPQSSYTTQTDAGINVVSFTPFGLLGRLFQYWRGSVIFKFKIVKTGFHSGRLVVAYVPWDSRFSQTAPTLDLSQYTERDIVDIREGNEFEVVCPYISYANWNYYDVYTSRLYVWVLDPLVAPATVSGTIQFLVEVCGGVDFDVSVPAQFTYVPYFPTAAQSADWKVAPCDLVIGNVGTSKVVPTDIHSRSCVGESIKSFRQLLKVPNQMCIKTTGYVNLPTASFYWPFWYACIRNNAGVASVSGYGADMYGLLCSMYLYSRGSVRVRVVPWSDTEGSGNGIISSTLLQQPQAFAVADFYINAGGTGFSTTRYKGSVVGSGSKLQSYSDCQVPQYGQYHSRNNSEWGNNFLSPPSLSTMHGPASTVLIQSRAFNAVGVQFWRTGGDDCAFGKFVSVPPMWDAGQA